MGNQIHQREPSINHLLPRTAAPSPSDLQNNFIKTSKYTMLTFLPLNLLEQFQRLANFYFLCLLLLQLIPAISSLTPVTTALPLIGVLMLTATKDAYDDYVSISGVAGQETRGGEADRRRDRVGTRTRRSLGVLHDMNLKLLPDWVVVVVVVVGSSLNN